MAAGPIPDSFSITGRTAGLGLEPGCGCDPALLDGGPETSCCPGLFSVFVTNLIIRGKIIEKFSLYTFS
jgi:hypothetical protein